MGTPIRAYKKMTVEVHKIYPIGLMEDGYTYYVEVCDRGTATWAFDLPDVFYEDERPTLPDAGFQLLLDKEEWVIEIPSEFSCRPSTMFTA